MKLDHAQPLSPQSGKALEATGTMHASEKGLFASLRNLRFGIKETLLAAALVINPANALAEESPYETTQPSREDEAYQEIFDTLTNPETAIQDVGKAVETVKEIWQKDLWAYVEFFQRGYALYGNMTESEMVQNADELIDFMDKAEIGIEKITETAGRLRAIRVRVHPKIAQYPLDIIKGLRQRILAANNKKMGGKYGPNRRKVIEFIAEYGWNSETTRRAKRGQRVFLKADEAKKTLEDLRMALESLIDQELLTEVNIKSVSGVYKAAREWGFCDGVRLCEILNVEDSYPPKDEELIGLGRGDEGPGVTIIQSRLVDAGYLSPMRKDKEKGMVGNVDGHFGYGTANALNQFNDDHDIPPHHWCTKNGITFEDCLPSDMGRVSDYTESLLSIEPVALEDNMPIRPGLHQGLHGPDVEMLQQRLVDFGVMKAKSVDGDFGNTTQNALSAFQKRCQAEISLATSARIGRVDKYTALALNAPQISCTGEFTNPKYTGGVYKAFRVEEPKPKIPQPSVVPTVTPPPNTYNRGPYVFPVYPPPKESEKEFDAEGVLIGGGIVLTLVVGGWALYKLGEKQREKYCPHCGNMKTNNYCTICSWQTYSGPRISISTQPHTPPSRPIQLSTKGSIKCLTAKRGNPGND